MAQNLLLWARCAGDARPPETQDAMNAVATRKKDVTKMRRDSHRPGRTRLTASGLDLVARYYWWRAKRRSASLAAALMRLLVHPD